MQMIAIEELEDVDPADFDALVIIHTGSTESLLMW